MHFKIKWYTTFMSINLCQNTKERKWSLAGYIIHNKFSLAYLIYSLCKIKFGIKLFFMYISICCTITRSGNLKPVYSFKICFILRPYMTMFRGNSSLYQESLLAVLEGLYGLGIEPRLVVRKASTLSSNIPSLVPIIWIFFFFPLWWR